MLVGNLIHQIPFPWVNKYGEKKVRQNLFSQRKPHSIPDNMELEIQQDKQASPMQCEFVHFRLGYEVQSHTEQQ